MFDINLSIILFYLVAFFSLPNEVVVAESDSAVEVCVTLMTFPIGSTLTEQVDLTLSTMSGSGKLSTSKPKYCHHSSTVASDVDGDYTAFSAEPLSFLSGSTDGSQVCSNISVASDGMVECEEDFTLLLALSTTESNLFLGNNSTAITLMDNDSMNRH